MASVARHLLKTNQKQPRADYSKVFKGRSAPRFARDDRFRALSSACEIRYLLRLEGISQDSAARSAQANVTRRRRVKALTISPSDYPLHAGQVHLYGS